jgi:hypothetical protein
MKEISNLVQCLLSQRPEEFTGNAARLLTELIIILYLNYSTGWRLIQETIILQCLQITVTGLRKISRLQKCIHVCTFPY